MLRIFVHILVKMKTANAVAYNKIFCRVECLVEISRVSCIEESEFLLDSSHATERTYNTAFSPVERRCVTFVVISGKSSGISCSGMSADYSNAFRAKHL
jgi:hypothetical protein